MACSYMLLSKFLGHRHMVFDTSEYPSVDQFCWPRSGLKDHVILFLVVLIRYTSYRR